MRHMSWKMLVWIENTISGGKKYLIDVLLECDGGIDRGTELVDMLPTILPNLLWILFISEGRQESLVFLGVVVSAHRLDVHYIPGDIVVVGSSSSSSGIIAVVTALSRSIYSGRGRIPVRLHITAFT